MSVKRPIRIDGEVAYVPLTMGYEALIDAADVPLLEQARLQVASAYHGRWRDPSPRRFQRRLRSCRFAVGGALS